MFVVRAGVDFLDSHELKYYDTASRRMRIGEFMPKELEKYSQYLDGLEYLVVFIPRACDKDGKYHRLLPPFLLPYKHYPAEEVASTFCNEGGQCTSAGDSTIKRWKKWWKAICGEFKMKALEWAKATELYTIIAATNEMTLAHTLKRLFPPFWMATILPLFTSEALRNFPHRL